MVATVALVVVDDGSRPPNSGLYLEHKKSIMGQYLPGYPELYSRRNFAAGSKNKVAEGANGKGVRLYWASFLCDLPVSFFVAGLGGFADCQVDRLWCGL